MTPETASQNERPTPPTPRLPGPDEVDQYVEHNSTEDVGITLGLITFHRPKSVNGAYWYWFQKWSPGEVIWFRLVAIGWLLSFTFLTATLVLGEFGIHLVPDFRYVSAPYFLVVLLQLVVIAKKPKLAFAREVLEQEGMVCFDCGYSLKNLPDKHTCPECGAAYEKTALQARWLDWMRAKDLRRR